MKKYIKYGYFTFLIFFFYTSSAHNASQINCSFDHLFPMTWYQKGLESLLSVWHIVSESFEKNDGTAMPYDLLLGKLVFAQFSVTNMVGEQVRCIPEDIAYVVMVVEKIQSLLSRMIISEKTDDFIACTRSILQSMQQQLVKL